jgi:hypothetical protein
MENPQVIKSSQTPLCFGNARFTVYAQGAVRLEYREQRNFPPTPSILTAPTLPSPLSAEVEQPDEKTIVLKTDQLTLTFINDGKPFSRDNLTIVHPQLHGKNQWSPGDVDEPLVTMLRSCDVWDNEQNFSREEHPGMLDLQGRACIVDKGQVYRSEDNAWVEVTTLPLRGQDWWFFGYGSDFAGALRDFVAVFGKIPLIPRWSFGFWYSKWFEFSQDDIVAIAQKYRSRGLPMDVMVVDTEWREQGWVGYNWHPERFPNPQKMMKELITPAMTRSKTRCCLIMTDCSLPTSKSWVSLPGAGSGRVTGTRGKVWRHGSRWCCQKPLKRVWISGGSTDGESRLLGASPDSSG